MPLNRRDNRAYEHPGLASIKTFRPPAPQVHNRIGTEGEQLWMNIDGPDCLLDRSDPRALMLRQELLDPGA